MIRLKNIVLALFIAPELLIILSVICSSNLFPELVKTVGDAVLADDEIWKYLPGLTLAFASTAITYSSKLRAPLENTSNKTLYEWPLYQLLVDRVYISLFYAITAVAASFYLWFFGKQLDPIKVAVIFLSSCIAAGTTALTMILAHQKLREILEKNS